MHPNGPRRIETEIPDVFLIEPRVYGDERGFFLETFHTEKWRALGVEADFVQDNHSLSRQGTLRGLHFQVQRPQGKLCRVTRGAVWDVAVDIRPGSPTFGQWTGAILSAENKLQIWVPRGFAHGFLVLSEEAEFLYKCDDFYDPSDERGLGWDDPALNIAWPWDELRQRGGPDSPILSPRDERHPPLQAIAV